MLLRESRSPGPRGCLVARGNVDWLAGLPLHRRMRLPDGSRVLLVHASPGRDDGPGLARDWSEAQLEGAGFSRAAADLLLVGHTHVPAERHVAGCHVVNPGPVSLPRCPGGLARWLVLDASDHGYHVEHRAEGYDLGAVIEDLGRQRHPAAAWLGRKMTSLPQD